MPTEHERRLARIRQRRHRARKRREEGAPTPLKQIKIKLPASSETKPIETLAYWCSKVLVIPPGHPNEGKPLELPEFGISFLKDAIKSRESLLSVGRKNAKSAIIAIYLLGRLVGPLAKRGYRAGVCSITKEKAGELKRQMQEIAEASNLQHIEFLKSPAPGRVEGPWGTVDILSADKGAGHASGFDDALVDELGLLKEADRQLINGMKSSISARNGRFIAISIQGDSPFTKEMVARRDDPSCAVHLYQPDPSCELDDEEAWKASNPGLGTIKSLEYMRDRARAALSTPQDAADFRAHDLNLPQDPSREMICSPSEWAEISSNLQLEPPPGARCVIGFDAGGAASMTAAAVLFPDHGILQVCGAFPITPDYGLKERGQSDGVGNLYEQMYERGELRVYEGRTTPVVPFLQNLADDLQQYRVLGIGADRFRLQEVRSFLDDAHIRWDFVKRGMGKGPTADGSADIRAFQRMVLKQELKIRDSLMMEHAIAESSLIRDPLGNPAIERARRRGRIDALSASVIAAGLADMANANKPRGGRYLGAA